MKKKRSSIAAAAAGKGGRLFSNLDDDLKHSPGSVVDAAALVAGTTIGAGVLAIAVLPAATATAAVTEPAGFGAAAPALFGAWLFSIATGLLLAEASLSFLCSTGRGGGSLLSLTRFYLGAGPSRVAGFCYVFLHEALLVAYISRGAEVIAQGVGSAALSNSSSSSLSLDSPLLLPLSALLFTVALGSACYSLPARKLDEANSVLVAGVVASFVALLAVALTSTSTAASTLGAAASLADPTSSAASLSSFSALDLRELSRADWAQLPPALPVLALAFVYQNTVSVVVSNLVSGRFFFWKKKKERKKKEKSRRKKKPTLTFFLPTMPLSNPKKNQKNQNKKQEGDAGKIRTAIVGGTLLPLVMFLAWDAVSLGSGGGGSSSLDPVAALSASSPLAAPLIATFSMLALVTSFFGFVLGLTDFLADALPTERAKENEEDLVEKEEEEEGEQQKSAPPSTHLSLRSLLPLNPGGRARAPVPYALTLLPPLAGAVAVPGAFLSALSAAGTYGVMALFGLLPAAVAGVARRRRRRREQEEVEERERGAGEASASSLSSPTATLVPGGDAVLFAVGGVAAAVIVNETVSRVMGP